MTARLRAPSVPGPIGAIAKASLVIGSLVFCVLVLEGLLRATDYVPADVSLYRANPAGGGSFRLKPNLHLVTRVGETAVAIDTNSHGMRWSEIPQRADSSLRRVAMVGDSFTFGLWADSVEHSLAGVAASVLRPQGFDVLNFGVPGYGLLDIELQIRQDVLAFNPRDIILITYNGNDLLDTYLGLDRYRVTGNGALQLDDRVMKEKIPARFLDETWTLRDAVRRRFRLYGLLGQVAKQIRMRRGEHGEARFRTTETYTSNVFWSRTRYPEFAEQARTNFLDALDRIRALCDARGIRLFIVSVPSLEQVSDPSFFREGYDIRLPQKHVEAFARGASIPYLDLLPALAVEARDRGRNLHVQSDGHFNTAGHQVSGERIAEFFLRESVK